MAFYASTLPAQMRKLAEFINIKHVTLNAVTKPFMCSIHAKLNSDSGGVFLR